MDIWEKGNAGREGERVEEGAWERQGGLKKGGKMAERGRVGMEEKRKEVRGMKE